MRCVLLADRSLNHSLQARLQLERAWVGSGIFKFDGASIKDYNRGPTIRLATGLAASFYSESLTGIKLESRVRIVIHPLNRFFLLPLDLLAVMATHIRAFDPPDQLRGIACYNCIFLHILQTPRQSIHH